MLTNRLKGGSARDAPPKRYRNRKTYAAVFALVCVVAMSAGIATLTSSDETKALTPYFDPNSGVYFELDETAHTAVIVDVESGRDIVDISGPISYGGEDYTVVEVRAGAMASKNNLTKVFLPDSVKTIGANAFNGCANLHSVQMKGAEHIGARAFKACTNLLTDANSFRDAAVIDEEAFSGALAAGSALNLQSCLEIKGSAFRDSKIKSVDIRNAETIGAYAFINCIELTQIICDNVQTVGTEAFRETKNLKSISLPHAVTVGEAAFMNSDLSAGVVFGDSLTTVSTRAFQNTKITSVDLKLATSISTEAFVSCTNLQSFAVSPLNTAYDTYTTGDVSGPGALYDKTAPSHKLILFPNARTGDFKLHSDTTAVADKVFASTRIEFVDLSNLAVVSDYMFYSNTSLKSVVMLNVASVGESAFEFCTALETVEFGPNPVAIGDKAFYGGAGSNYIKRLEIPKGSTVGARAFEGNTSLEHLTVWDDLTYGADSFRGCANLYSLTVRRDSSTAANILPSFAWSFGGNVIADLTLDMNTHYDLGANLAPAAGKQLRLTSSTTDTTILGGYEFNDNGAPLDSLGRAGGLYAYESPTSWKLISRTFTVVFWGMEEADVNSDYQNTDISKYTRVIARMEVELDKTLEYLPSQSLERYIVGGWYSAPGGGTQLDLSTKIQSSMNVYAKYAPKMYTVQIDADPAAGGVLESSGASGSASTGASGTASKTYQYGEQVTLTATAAGGYGFIGMTEGDNPLSRDYGSLIGYAMNFNVPSDRRYTAHFDKIWNLTFDPAGGVFDGGSVLRTYIYVNGEALDNSGIPMGRTSGLYPGDPTKSGLHFQGWYTADGVKVETTSAITKDATLTARWYAEITFDANGGSVNGAGSHVVRVDNVGVTDTLFSTIAQKAAAPAGTGYIFDAWYVFTGSAYGSEFLGTTVISADATVKAKWNARLTLDPNSGSFGTPLEPGYVADGSKIYYDIALDDGESYPPL
ncbi:MAG: leucine-rich repeat protein, partial [Candidatus Methanoplasma sp.]|nr:leucine-rich repeat protein [Candidatus Methanoplasma sp.]